MAASTTISGRRSRHSEPHARNTTSAQVSNYVQRALHAMIARSKQPVHAGSGLAARKTALNSLSYRAVLRGWAFRPYRNTLHGPCLVVPTTTEPQPGNPWAFKLTTSIDGRDAWVICNQPSTVAPSRLSPAKGKVPRLSEAEFKEVLALLLRWLPRPLEDLGADV